MASRSVRTPLTTAVSPLATLSTSVSFASTLPVALAPPEPLATPPASTAIPVSFWPTGLSLLPWSVTVSVAPPVAPARSAST